MSTIYVQSIIARQSPFPIGLDESEREVFSVNFDARAETPTRQWEEVITKILTDASLVTVDANYFIGSGRDIPSGDGPYITLLSTGGITPLETHNGDQTDRPSFQILVTARDYRTCRDKINAIWAELHGKRNVNVTVT